MPDIPFHEISIVVQGPIYGRSGEPKRRKLTERVLESLRRHLPGAWIILSTWAGSDVAGLDYDELVLSEDPGGHPFGARGNPKILNNVNRQICSTVAGLSRVKTPYAIKTRTDLLIRNRGFLNFFDRYNRFDPDWRILEKRVVTCNVYARNPRSDYPFLYHPGDFFFFGLTKDLLAIWDVPPQPKGYSRWFLLAGNPPFALDHNADIRYFPEQYLWISFLRKHAKEVGVEYATDFSEQELERSERSFANNLVLLNAHQCGVSWLKKRLSLWDESTLYSHREWLDLYHRLVLGGSYASREWFVQARPILSAYRELGAFGLLKVRLFHLRNQLAVLLNRLLIRAPKKLIRLARRRQESRA